MTPSTNELTPVTTHLLRSVRSLVDVLTFLEAGNTRRALGALSDAQDAVTIAERHLSQVVFQ